MKNILIGLLVLGVVGAGAYYLFAKNKVATADAAVAEENAVALADHPSIEEEVVVSYAKLSKPGYLIIYGLNHKTGVFGTVGRSELLAAGEHKNVKVPTSLQNGVQLLTRIHAWVVADNGDGQYVAAEDIEKLAITDENTNAEVDITATNPELFSAEEIADLLERDGYTVSENTEVMLGELADGGTTTTIEGEGRVEGEVEAENETDESGGAAGTFEEGQVPEGLSDEEAASQ